MRKLLAEHARVSAWRYPIRIGLAWIRHAIALLRTGPSDLASEAGRWRERDRRALLSVLASGVARISAIGVTLVSIPLTVGYLGTERFGLWVAVGSLTAMLSFTDLGLGNGLVNAVAQANGSGDRLAAQKYVSSAFFMLMGISMVLSLIFATVYLQVDWPALFNVSSATAVEEAGPAVAAFALCFLLGLPAGIAQRVHMGYQEVYAASLWSAFGSIVGLAGLLVVVTARAGLPWLVLAVSGGPVLAGALNWFYLWWKRPWLRPRSRSADANAARRLLSVGLAFVLMQLAVSVAYSSDILVAARVVGPDAAAQYAITQRLFGFAPAVVSLLLFALWPAYGEAITRGDVIWVLRTLRLSILVSLALTGSVSGLLLIFGSDVIRLWVGPSIDVPFMLLAGMAVWAVLSNVFAAIGALLMGANIMRFQATTAVLMAAASLPLSIVLAQSFGVGGVIWGTVIAFALFTAGPTLLYLPRIVRELGDGPVGRSRMFT